MPEAYDTTIEIYSSETALGTSAAWNSSIFSVQGMSTIRAMVFSDVVLTLQIQQSMNGVNWDVIDELDVLANKGAGILVGVVGTSVRARFLNAAQANQTVFRALVFAQKGD